MQRLNSVDLQSATGRTQELLESVKGVFGTIPNSAQVMANSPAVLSSFLAFSTAMADTKIDAKLQNQLKLITSEKNECDYCSSLLVAVAPAMGLSSADVLAGRSGHSEDTRTKAALAFAHDVLENRGKVSDARLAAVREAGFSDAEIVEMVASVVLGCFTNFLNNVADTELDIPAAEPLAPAASCGTDTCSH
ncbi:carboxymuconolactone decarboxylase family protein [Bremerella cremea]|uniref:Carboxymuconolactone decarboxylase family protein n=1 Tax=Bremerella cremea TaxID=1031537 RepID=A0A368KMF0_9BACT|nr:carboxymuconolactone decarboxylase family protein [Bremerella cremea]RCS43270.1 carboxymuconolactone decarboxylase family protein [Bremerella cremea]